MKFKDEAHKRFFIDSLTRSRSDDECHKALFYTLGLTETTRRIINSLYDFSSGCIIPDGILNPAQTGTSVKITRLAFNLFTGGCPSENPDEMMLYLPSEVFCTSLLPWMLEAVKVRYPDYC